MPFVSEPKKIVDRFEEEGVKIEKVIGIGGVARKSPFIMQTLANVLNMPIVVAASDQAPALGAAIYAAVAAGIYPTVQEASQKMGSDFEAEYFPQTEKVEKYAEFMKQYQVLADFTENNIKSKRKLTAESL
jgi:L-ribulokinase